ncbi:hypothetical protein FN960_03050 [Alkalicoccobacillus porphyridii]|uniref:Uncharacterized protein n=2 Tax=Alkalicoccobacillus porphyridii TaxID=2597270 RepID=A0A554A4E3_9BACI|nr:hypothetical protein FN960_03050 [Alkalicoccobacillus porphyridii]
MKKKVSLAVLSIIIVVGSYFVIREFTQTGVTALDDSFTREFLDEDVEVGDGFYFYEARNGKYTMWLSEDYFIVQEPTLFYSKDQLENINLEHNNNSTEIRKSIKLQYRGRNYDHTETAYRDFEELSDIYSFENQHEVIEDGDRLIYFGSSNQWNDGGNIVTRDSGEYDPNRYFALVSTVNGSQYATIQYGIYYDGEACGLNQNEEEQFFQGLLLNIRFN